MRHLKFSGFIILFFTAFALHAKSLQQDIDALIQQTLPHATVGVFIKEASSDRVIYARNADKLLSPASNIKMFTAAAGLYQLGPHYRYTTTLSKNKKNLYITFSGAPSLTSDDLEQLLLPLQTRGTIEGNIILDSSHFKPPYHVPGMSYDDLGWYFEAPSSAIILDGNAMAYDFISHSSLGKPIQIKSQAIHNPLTIINDVMTVSKEQARDHCTLHIGLQPNNRLHLYGCLAQVDHPQKMELAITNPVLYAKQVIKNSLRKNHIQFNGHIIEGITPHEAILLASHQSEPLIKLVTHMLQESDNLYADSLTKELGFSLTNQGSFKQGAFAIKSIITSHSHIDSGQLELADGQGTRYSATTPQQMVVFLSDIYQDNKMNPLFLNALPCMGVSGTLKDRMKKTPIENKVLAKTGSMHDISALSGFLQTPSGKTVIFSIISNGINGDSMKGKALEDKILLRVFKAYERH